MKKVLALTLISIMTISQLVGCTNKNEALATTQTPDNNVLATNKTSDEELDDIQENSSDTEQQAQEKTDEVAEEAKQQSVNNPEEGYAEREVLYNKAGFTSNQKLAAENYVIYEGYTVEEAIKEVKAIGVPKEAVKSNTVKTPTTTTQSKPATTTQSSSSSGVIKDADGAPTTGALSQASMIENGGDPSKLADVGTDNCYSSGTAEGDKGLN